MWTEKKENDTILSQSIIISPMSQFVLFFFVEKTRKKKKAQKPKKDEYCQIVTGVKVDDPDNIQYTENGVTLFFTQQKLVFFLTISRERQHFRIMLRPVHFET